MSRSRRHAPLHAALDEARARAPTTFENDPVCFPRRYADPTEAAIVGIFAAQLAFGRVSLFAPVLTRLFAEMEAYGGPRAWIAHPSPGTDPLIYRWFGREDFTALGGAIHRLLGELSLPEAFSGPDPIERGVSLLHAHAQGGGRFFHTWFARPSSGSACKRWCMFLRWMVRPEPPDLGLWTHLSPAALVMPVDTHVLRIAQLTGLTARKAATWKTAVEITASLRRFAPADPVRYDFALAHLGISAGCTGQRGPACEACAMVPVCKAWSA